MKKFQINTSTNTNDISIDSRASSTKLIRHSFETRSTPLMKIKFISTLIRLEITSLSIFLESYCSEY